MNGVNDDPELTTIKPAIDNSNKIIGQSQNFFLTLKKFKNSLKKLIYFYINLFKSLNKIIIFSFL